MQTLVVMAQTRLVGLGTELSAPPTPTVTRNWSSKASFPKLSKYSPV